LLGICEVYFYIRGHWSPFGRRSDGIFRDGQAFHNKQMNLLEPKPITSDGQPLPYVLVGDEAFQLSNYLLRPYPGRESLNLKIELFFIIIFVVLEEQ